jgi:hypothetical protein
MVQGEMVDAISYEELTAKIDKIFAGGNVVSVGYSTEDGEDEEVFASDEDMKKIVLEQMARMQKR